MMEPEVLIIGAGPAGLSAAARLAREGVRTLVLDREPDAGGIPRHCAHSPYGLREFQRLMRGPAYARRLVGEAAAAGAEIRTRTTVTALLPGGRIELTSPDGPATLTAAVVLLATGVRETSRAARLIGGEKQAGVMSTGALQGIVHLNHQRPFQRPVILGSELVAFSALLSCRQAGITPVAMLEAGSRITAQAPAQWLPRALGVPLRLNTRVTQILGRSRVERVLIETASGPDEIVCDGVVLTGGFRPEASLVRASHLGFDPGSGGPLIDSFGRLTDPAYFAAGNLLRGVETAGWCWGEGQRVAGAIHASLLGRLPSPGGARLQIATDAVSLAVPQVIALGQGAETRLQLRLSRPARGRLRLVQEGKTLLERRIDSLPERRIAMPLPRPQSDADIFLTLEV